MARQLPNPSAKNEKITAKKSKNIFANLSLDKNDKIFAISKKKPLANPTKNIIKNTSG